MSWINLQRFFLVEVVVPLHVLGFAVGLGLDDSLHICRPTKPRFKGKFKVFLQHKVRGFQYHIVATLMSTSNAYQKGSDFRPYRIFFGK